MSDLIALWIGRGVMGLAGLAVLTFLGWLALQFAWAAVIRPAVQLADFHQWRRAKANGSWQEPRILSRAEEKA
jgi:hypothetical protein